MKSIKLKFFISFLLPLCVALNAQTDNPATGNPDSGSNTVTEIKTFYLLLGTLSDYMGHPTFVDKPHQVDYYHYYEESLVSYLDSIIRSDLEHSVSRTFEKGKYETFSEELSKMLNSCYHDGLIDETLFTGQGEICSFLTGRYYRFGEQLNDSIYRIQLPNSPNNALIDTLLRRIGCRDIFFRHLKLLPAQFVYYFIPPPSLKSCLISISGPKKILKAEYRAAARKTLGPDQNVEEMFRIRNERELKQVTDYFRNNLRSIK